MHTKPRLALSGDDYDKLVRGDPDVEDIYYWTAEGQNVPMHGATGKGDGSHIMTGPIYVCGAEPGDVLQVRGVAGTRLITTLAGMEAMP